MWLDLSLAHVLKAQFISSVYPWLRITGKAEVKVEQGQAVGTTY